MIIDSLEKKLLKYGYTGYIIDLIDYSGSEDALIWYWENYLEKILSNAKGYYGGAFIRFKVKAEARKKYDAYQQKLAKIEESKANDEKHIKEQIDKARIQEQQLAGWYSGYSRKDKSTQNADLKNYIYASGYFEFYTNAKKQEFLTKTERPCNLKEPHRFLFQKFYSDTHKTKEAQNA